MKFTVFLLQSLLLQERAAFWNFAMEYDEKKHHYKQERIASGYDDVRFSGRKKGRNKRKIAAIKKALALIDQPGLMLDMPAGTGRFYEFLSKEEIPFVGADISLAMLMESRDKADNLRLAVADAERHINPV